MSLNEVTQLKFAYRSESDADLIVRKTQNGDGVSQFNVIIGHTCLKSGF